MNNVELTPPTPSNGSTDTNPSVLGFQVTTLGFQVMIVLGMSSLLPAFQLGGKLFSHLPPD